MRNRAAACLTLSLITLLLISPLNGDDSEAFDAESTASDPIFHDDHQSHNAAIRVYNPFPHAITVTVDLTRQENLRVNPSASATVIVPAGKQQRVLMIRPIHRRKPWSYDYKWSWRPGSFTAVHDDNTIYMLPYPPGHAYPLSQGAGGDFSHKNRHAFDWSMPEGTPVHAARSGVVVRVVDDFIEGALDASLKDKANRIHILHADQTLGRYLHLMASGAAIKVGQHVDAGELIGYSGNTGYSQGPHLHFDVYAPRDGKTGRTFPIRFDLGGVNPAEPEQIGMHYLRPFEGPADQAPPLPLNTIHKLITAPGIADDKPHDPRVTFQSDETVHAYATISIPGDYTLRFVFSRHDDPAGRYERTLDTTADERWAWTSFDLRSFDSPIGSWQVEVLIGEQSFHSFTFDVN